MTQFRTTILLIALFMVIHIFTLSAQDTIVIDGDDKLINLDIETAVNLALANNLGLENSKIDFAGNKWKIITAWNTFLPDVRMSASLAHSNKSKEDRTFSQPVITDTPPYMSSIDVTAPEWMINARFDLTFNFNAAMIFQVNQSVIDYKNGKISMEQAKKQLILNVKKNYYSLVVLANSINVKKEDLIAAKDRYDQAIENFRNGLKPELDMLSAQVKYELTKPEVLDAENSYNTALVAFKQMLGLKSEVTINFVTPVKTDSKELVLDDLLSRVHDRLEIRQARLGLQTARNQRNMLLCFLTPSISLMYSMDPTFQFDAFNKDINDTGENDYESWFENNAEHWKQQSGMFTFSVSLPITSWFPFSKEQVNLIGANYAIKKLKNTVEIATQGAELEIKSLYMKIDKSQKSMEKLALNIELTKKALKQTENAYKAGTIGLGDVQDAQFNLNKAKFMFLSEEFNYTTGLLDLEYAINSEL